MTGRYVYPRGVRLLTRGDYSRVFSAPIRATNQCFTILWRTNQNQRVRLGLAVSRKHARKAVERNRIKRVIRESFRHVRTELPPMDAVVLTRNGVAGRTTTELRTSLDGLWKRFIKKCRSS